MQWNKNKAPVKKWIETLRKEPTYPQEYWKLKNGDAHCALGVLFEVNGYLSGDGKLRTKKAGGKLVKTNAQALQVLEKLGVPLSLANDVVQLNDEQREPFSRIADYIEHEFGAPEKT